MTVSSLDALQRYFDVTDRYRVEDEGEQVFARDVILDLPRMETDLFERRVLVGRDDVIQHFVSKGRPPFRRHSVDHFVATESAGVAVVTSHLPDDRTLPLLCHWQVDEEGLLCRYAVWVLDDDLRGLIIVGAPSPQDAQRE